MIPKLKPNQSSIFIYVTTNIGQNNNYICVFDYKTIKHSWYLTTTYKKNESNTNSFVKKKKKTLSLQVSIFDNVSIT